jgi:hypothetical protein
VSTRNHPSPQNLRLVGSLLAIIALLAFILLFLLNMRQAGAAESAPAAAPGLTQVRIGDIELPLPTTKDDFFLPGTQPHTLIDSIPAPTSCQVCHSQPIYGAYRGSMMAQAGRDPLFWAAFAVANADASGAGDFCLRCHTPKGWLEGRSEPADGSALLLEDIDAGVACEVCHRMVDPVPGAQDETAELDIAIRAAITATLPVGHVGSAMLIVDPYDNRRGPFQFPNQMTTHTAFQSNFQNQGVDAVAASRLCGSCHNVDNPLLSWNENPPGGGPPQYWPNDIGAAAPSFDKGDIFPLERTFDEWLASDYAMGGVFAPQFAGAKPDGIVASCQDCHMERQTGQAAQPFLNPVDRDCETTGCLPAHILVGGNAWIPEILQDPRWRLHNAPDELNLQATAAAARSMLERSAMLTATIEDTATGKTALVRVTNQTGHKLPTGYPEGRRMWLNLQAFDADGRLIYESAAYDWDTGLLTRDPAAKVYEVKQGRTPELAAWLGEAPGESFHFAMNNTTIKDNRIPPRGYTVAAFDQPGMRPVGATFADGQYWDDTSYDLPPETARIVAKLYYQTTSSEYIEFLAEKGGADGQTLAMLWEDSKSPPVLVSLASFPPVYVPVVSQP